MDLMLSFVVGAILGLGFVLLARRHGEPGERRALAAGLAVAALIYVGFATFLGATGRWLGIELAGFVLFGAIAFIGVRWLPWLLPVGWVAHAFWDAPLHLSGAGTTFTPDWYPPFCLAFDLVIALYLTIRLVRSSPTLRRAY